jgi:hypothetical protein
MVQRAFLWKNVGVAGFEPTASSSRTTRATGLRYTPKNCASIRHIGYFQCCLGRKKPPGGVPRGFSDRKFFGRSGRIRTYDLQHPMLARYQATLHPDELCHKCKSAVPAAQLLPEILSGQHQLKIRPVLSVVVMGFIWRKLGRMRSKKNL